jgi:pimeloyl-ACP methyl ester carboxylesterase
MGVVDRSGGGPERSVRHCWTTLDGIDIFHREAGPPDAPVLLLPHGYPCSSFQFRQLMPALADGWRTIAPDFPGFGLSGTPAPGRFRYNFEGYAEFLERLVDAMGLDRFAIWLHDYGSQIGLRLAIRMPDRIAALVIQNGDIYEDQLGPKYAPVRQHWAAPSAETRAVLEEAVSEEGFRAEFVGEIAETLVPRVPPDLWKLHWPLMNTPVRREVALGLMEGLRENLAWFPRYQSYLREHRPPALIVWGPQDGYMPEGAARAYLRDLPEAELHLLNGGHWLLETHFDEVLPLVRDFLARTLGNSSSGRRD